MGGGSCPFRVSCTSRASCSRGLPALRGLFARCGFPPFTGSGARSPRGPALAGSPPLARFLLFATATYDLVSREAMRTAVRESPALSPLLPFARLWYVRESIYLWCAGEHSHRICQSEGGEQGDPLVPALFSVALAPALHDLQRELRPTEQVLAYLDDVYMLASPDRSHCCTAVSRT